MTGVVPFAEAAQVFFQTLDRVAERPRGELVLRAIAGRIVAGRVGTRAVGDMFDEGRTVSGAGAFRRPSRGGVHRQKIVPIDAKTGERTWLLHMGATDPAVVIKESGADILRLWVSLVDYAEDQRIGKQILQTTVDAYRKLRNTVRYLLGALVGFDEGERLPLDQMPPLEKFILHRLW